MWMRRVMAGGAAAATAMMVSASGSTSSIARSTTDGVRLSRKVRVLLRDLIGTDHRRWRASRPAALPISDLSLLLQGKCRPWSFPNCPFRVRACLDFFGFSYEVVEVNPVTRSQIKFSTYRKVPILVFQGVHDQQVNDSSLIVSLLASLLQSPTKSLDEIADHYPSHVDVDPKTKKEIVQYPNKYVVLVDKQLTAEQMQFAREEREWREWVDNHFIHLISPNVYRTWTEALSTFHWFSEAGDWRNVFPTWERLAAVYVGAGAMYVIAKRLKKRHGIVDEREAIFAACNEWVKAIGPDRVFLGGHEPNLADLIVRGFFNELYFHTPTQRMCMEIAFDLRSVFDTEPIVRLDAVALRRLNPRRCWAIQKLINDMGQLSADIQAQRLRRVLTTYEKVLDSDEDQVLYILWRTNPANERASIIIGLLKVGRKHLYLWDNRTMRCFDPSPLCILDFFIFPSLQRRGHGHMLFDYMLQEGVSPDEVAIDKPSESLVSFMAKHYGLNEPIWQNTNYVVYPGFFDHLEEKDETGAGHQMECGTPRVDSGTERHMRETCTPSRGRSTAAGIIHGTEALPTRLDALPDTPQGRKNIRDYGHQSLW